MANSKADGVDAAFTIAHLDDECFVWTRTDAEWTFGITDEDIIQRFDTRGDEVGRELHADYQVVYGDPYYQTL